MKIQFNDLVNDKIAQIEYYLADAQSILAATNSEQLIGCIENSQSGISSIYENGISDIKVRLKELGLKTNFDEQQNFLLSQYIGFNLQEIIFDEFFPTLDGTEFDIDNIPNLLSGGAQGDDSIKLVRFLKFIGLTGKSMFAISIVSTSKDISSMDQFISDLNESTIIGHSWNSPLISIFPQKDSAFFMNLYSTKDWKKKFHHRCANVVNEMLMNINKLK